MLIIDLLHDKTREVELQNNTENKGIDFDSIQVHLGYETKRCLLCSPESPFQRIPGRYLISWFQSTPGVSFDGVTRIGESLGQTPLQ